MTRQDIVFDFKGQSVIVTGAARGIGLELSRFFAESGAHIFMVDYDLEALKTAANEIGAVPLVADVSNTSQVEKVVSAVIAATGQIDVLVNNAGILRDQVLWKLSDEDWEAVIAVHAGGTFKFTRACTPHFREKGYGRIINVTSYTGLHGNVGQANYATAKAGIIGFTKSAAKELARFGVTINAISPNAETRMIESIPDTKKNELAKMTPIGRFGTAKEMCAAVGFLASHEAGYITGVVLPVDGGLSI